MRGDSGFPNTDTGRWVDDNGLNPNDSYTVYANSGCQNTNDPKLGWFPWREACADSVAYFGIGIGVGNKDTTLEKYVVAHELGHQIQAHQRLLRGAPYTLLPNTPASCRCDHVTVANSIHCLQSRHAWDAADAEGWAHFIAARTFNRADQADCTFVYYKDVRWDNGQVALPPVAVDCAAQTRWVPNHCPAAGQSSEWDMLGFLRELDRDGPNGLSMTELFGIYHAAPGRSWEGFRAGALKYFGNNPSHPKYQRVVAVAAAYGVAQ